jgi:hypothetical protein
MSTQQLQEIGRQSTAQIKRETQMQPLIDKQMAFEMQQFDQLEQQRAFEAELEPLRREIERKELEAIAAGPGATEEQKALIAQATEQGIAAGTSDIERFRDEGIEQIRSRLAPSLGLRPGDTPLVDRGQTVQNEAARLQGQLVSGFRGQQAEAELNFPLAAGQFQAQRTQAQQGLGAASDSFIAQLQQQITANRLGNQGQSTSTGLGLAGMTSATGGPSFLQRGAPLQKGESTLGATLGGIGGALTGGAAMFAL